MSNIVPIYEMTFMQKNKNIINRIKRDINSELKKYEITCANFTTNVAYSYDFDFIPIKFLAEGAFDLGDVEFVEYSGKIYMLAKIIHTGNTVNVSEYVYGSKAKLEMVTHLNNQKFDAEKYALSMIRMIDNGDIESRRLLRRDEDVRALFKIGSGASFDDAIKTWSNKKEFNRFVQIIDEIYNAVTGDEHCLVMNKDMYKEVKERDKLILGYIDKDKEDIVVFRDSVGTWDSVKSRKNQKQIPLKAVLGDNMWNSSNEKASLMYRDSISKTVIKSPIAHYVDVLKGGKSSCTVPDVQVAIPDLSATCGYCLKRK